MDNNNDNDTNQSISPYKATKNLNTVIDNPSADIDNKLDVNIKDIDNSTKISETKISNLTDSLFQSKINKSNTNSIEQQYINKVFNFDANSSLSNKKNNDDLIIQSNLDKVDDNKIDSKSNVLNSTIVKSDDNSSTKNSNIIQDNNNFSVKDNDLNNNYNENYNHRVSNNKKYVAITGKKKNTKFEFGSEFKVIILIAIILLIFLIFLPMINKVIIGY